MIEGIKAVDKRLTEPKPTVKSKPVFNLKPFLGCSSRWSRNIVEDSKNMGKTDHDQHVCDCLYFVKANKNRKKTEKKLIKIIIVHSYFQR